MVNKGTSGSTASTEVEMDTWPPKNLEDLWMDFKANGTKESRDMLVLHYAPLVKYVAGRIGAGLPSSVEQGDLISSGIFGLIDALERYDTERGVKFETYAVARIRGGILDELRSLDWVPRSLRIRSKQLEQTYRSLEAQLKRTPKDDEIASAMGIEEKSLATLMEQMSYSSLLALDETVSAADGQERISLLETLEDSADMRPESSLELVELRRMVREVVENLPQREQLLINLYYYEGLTLREIGGIMGITESRASQLHTKAILRLKLQLNNLFV